MKPIPRSEEWLEKHQYEVADWAEFEFGDHPLVPELIEFRHALRELLRSDDRLPAVVAAAVTNGVTWDQIAQALGVSPADARATYEVATHNPR